MHAVVGDPVRDREPARRVVESDVAAERRLAGGHEWSGVRREYEYRGGRRKGVEVEAEAVVAQTISGSSVRPASPTATITGVIH